MDIKDENGMKLVSILFFMATISSNIENDRFEPSEL
jgi:hypothetical protein